MRGVVLFLIASGLVAGALNAPAAQAEELGALSKLAREKAEAVSLLKANASNQVATLAQDRIFMTYLYASTQSEGARLRERMAAMFTALWGRFGLREIALFDVSGARVVRVGNTRNAPGRLDVKSDPVLRAALAQRPFATAAILDGDAIIYATPVRSRTRAEFVLSGRQAFAAYATELSRGAPAGVFVALVDGKGAILADTRNAGSANVVVAGLSLDALRRAVGGTNEEGAGEVARGNEHYYVSYRAAGDWTVVTGATSPGPRRCSNAGARLCG